MYKLLQHALSFSMRHDPSKNAIMQRSIPGTIWQGYDKLSASKWMLFTHYLHLHKTHCEFHTIIISNLQKKFVCEIWCACIGCINQMVKFQKCIKLSSFDMLSPDLHNFLSSFWRKLQINEMTKWSWNGEHFQKPWIKIYLKLKNDISLLN